MDPVHVHLLLNHVAILAAVFSLVIYFAGIFISQRILVRTALIGFVFSALVAIPVFLTGEPAEELVENLPGISQDVIHEHEEAAEYSIWMIQFLGIISLFAFFLFDKYERFFKWLIIVIGILATIALAKTGYEGGKIRHTEIHGSIPTPAIEQGDSDDD